MEKFIHKKKGKENTMEKSKKYFCNVTKVLQTYIDKKFGNNSREIFITITEESLKNRVFTIDMIGATLGAIWLDNDFCITDIDIDDYYTGYIFPNNINELLEKFIGQKIEIEE